MTKFYLNVFFLSNCIDDMREMILQGIRTKQTFQKCQTRVNKFLSDSKNDVDSSTHQNLPTYSYNSLCINKK